MINKKERMYREKKGKIKEENMALGNDEPNILNTDAFIATSCFHFSPTTGFFLHCSIV